MPRDLRLKTLYLLTVFGNWRKNSMSEAIASCHRNFDVLVVKVDL